MQEIPKVILGIDSSRAYGRGLLRGIAKFSRLNGPWTFYSEPGFQGKNIVGLNNWKANGIITQFTDPKIIKEIMPHKIPTIAVVVNQQIEGLPNIIGDWEKEGQMAADYLINKGFTKFAFCGFAKMQWSRDRGRGFRNRIIQSDFEVFMYEHPWIRQRSWDKEQHLIISWLKTIPKPIAVMACNDDRGRHVLEACKIAGLKVPEEVAVLGVDNDETVCDLTHPLLSSIDVDTEKAGYEAAELLQELMLGKKATKDRIIVQPKTIVTRQSTDIMAIQDADVIEAVRFIRQNAKEHLQVNDVTEAVAVSRRPLERKFRKTLGRSIYEEVRRVRIEEIIQLLLETDLSVFEIASRLGFASIDHISRFFRQERGLSPVNFRKQFSRAHQH
ncbi:MAG: DNA-binding transcriptional regulator [Phycisphaerales bacterium]